MEHRDEIDKWLYEEMQVIPGCCASVSALQYDTARRVAEKLWNRNSDGPKWRKIQAGEHLPCKAYLYNLVYDRKCELLGFSFTDGILMPSEIQIRVDTDTWYLPVEDIRNLPKEE